MKRAIIIILTTIGCAASIAWAASITIERRSNIANKLAELAKLERANDFACGYIAGQRAIMARMPSSFPPVTLPDAAAHCAEVRDLARAHIFQID